MTYLENIRNLTKRVRGKVENCPPMDPPSQAEIQTILPLFQNVKLYIMSKGKEGSLDALNDCRVYNILKLTKEDVPQGPMQWFDWLTKTESNLIQSAATQPNIPNTSNLPAKPNTTIVNIDDESKWYEYPLLTLGDYTLTPPKLLVGFVIYKLIRRKYV